MPIEIKELHIKINVDDGSRRGRGASKNGGDKDKIIEACVEQVMEILSKKEER
ncbi:hypothetical protein SAMN06265379_10412 [Saccharicrinis carchari]|uniref:Uncharacterized protein n=1 Tax=Saccharicrinis carchari TaxID=1168039 RepID=A0A521CX93_SACCC|nr:DUF5908 family protein [Saccharicrinis carchari]SMO64044.1 hypothetical protein SAMN06265379_10412 [Saccharicrinis carchari]